ncbi:Asp-tRNA(Asn)/Glu-tRNA(Gln) amidotransferase subunit GatC [Paenalcaligenes niemegkensis]|uniref:Asp-tRNA(Asn)/Glu-tRNA(Gln) amidotransferase subunit GatC n=1 Tax=Paenalcaligenes niemegkensis TaxID=2895469 RepID=UPI001EE9AC06|nr:Asp-tRNA(Asn)/Glu-tRNA(Gln) amidotransferase subunit GatC [Paenalcaligenes niemegkensis]MCQ9615501.1 Asp-tRNA(Asn)/Glu-tRNA(Gln) amidotransferase subunit GatC [Paenalcaligenes niemegkensis]
MAISQQDVARIAQLAHIELSPEQTAQAEQDFGRIIGLIQALQSVDTSGVEPMAHPLAAIQEISLRLRPDQAAPTATEEQRQALMANAPAQDEGLFLVPTVIE